MTRAIPKTTKAHNSFAAHKPPKKTRSAAVNAVAEALQLRVRYNRIKSERKRRIQRLRRALLGTNRKFAGHVIIPSPQAARESDFVRLSDIQKEFENGEAAVYWVDGSARGGYLGAAVVWHTNTGIRAKYSRLGESTGGCNNDAELFAIAAALRRARRLVQEHDSNVRLLRIYTDAQTILTGLKNGTCPCIGPFHDRSMALKRLYEDTDWLISQDIRVELIWVKGHKASEGNRIADEAASKAVETQLIARDSNSHTREERYPVPQKWRQLGPDWAAEWMYRANRPELDSLSRSQDLECGRSTSATKLFKLLEAVENSDHDWTSNIKSDSKKDSTETPEGIVCHKGVNTCDQHKGAASASEAVNQHSILQSSPRVEALVPGLILSTRRLPSRQTTRVARTSARKEILQNLKLGQALPEPPTTSHAKCMKSLLTWGRVTAPCVTRLRTRSGLDSV